MADETVTTPENTPATERQNQRQGEQTVPAAAQTPQPAPSDQQEEAAPSQAGAQPAQPTAPKPGAPSPAAFAKKTPHIPATPSAPSYNADELKAAEAFGRVDEQGSVFVREGEAEREVGQFPDAASPDEALELYARRYLDLKERLDLFATRLKAANIKSREIDESLKSLQEETKEPAVVGDIAALRQQLSTLEDEGKAKKAQLSEERKASLDKAIQERTALVEEAEAIVAGLGDQTNWRQTADKFHDLFERWQTHQRTTIRIDKKHADALWKRFSSARSAFNQARRKWAQERDAHRAEAKRIKEEIIAQADAIKDSTDWGGTSREFNAMMDRWKAAGRAGRNEDDALWARFRQSADVFFNARQADREKTSTDEQENLKAKEALLTRAEALLPVKDESAAKQARQALARIQEEWDQIGYVPRADMHRIESRLDAVDRQIKSVEDAVWQRSDPEADARKSSFETQLESQLAELDQRIAQEADPAKKQALQAEKATKEQWLKAVK
ncbi:DNA repair ATPase [Bifidobacterium actinocoloniiforme DSM 22766]|uniref:DNA repair ATPase n=1 Tax=Bifidobacterium actinocoloniiforme DSM 22766 TaxID=1437605 RepID=A0A086Z0S2_9BIFI|nr:DUF349 domain-containing protein [Bifidobacterium actinocoloniiforme]AKV55326.1 DNA repair protein [Bifidobacterium actinocoloniiforme DSM 22766]KFI40122.1 DNA repair ATPase [Bifidobacterium actinocoloniiforme DSM 22766]